VSFAPFAFAQDIFLKPNKSQEEVIDKLLQDEVKPEALKTANDYANQYFQNCLQTDHPYLKGKDLELLCGCTSAKFSEVMTPQNVQAMQHNTPEGQHQRNRVLMFVYAPCIEYPTRAMILSECLSKPQTQHLMKNPSSTCKCLADGVAEDMAELAPQYIESSIRRNPENLDPLGLLMNSEAFEKRSIYHSRLCLSKHER